MITERTHIAAAVLLFTSTLFAEESDYPRGQLLIEPAAIAGGDAERRFVILDARERDAYDAGHVPDAVWVDHGAWSKGFGEGTDAQRWSSLIGGLGIDSTTPVAIYDDHFANDAARIWWILKYWGVQDVRLVNGGWKTWAYEGLPISTEVPSVEIRPFRAVPAAKRLASKQRLLDSLKSGTLQIVDARSEAEHCGTDAMKNKKAGAIPGARHLEWIDLIDRNTARFKPSAELKKIYDAAGIDLKRPSATHCQGGGRAAVMAFGMELMGAENVSNYYKSWGEWGNADDTPVVKPPLSNRKP